MVIFIIGCVIFTTLMGLISYLMLSRRYSKRFYISLTCFYLMTILQLLYFYFGKNILGPQSYSILLIATCMLITIFVILYVMLYTMFTPSISKVKLLFLLPIIIVEIVQIVFVGAIEYKESTFFLITLSVSIISITIAYVQIFVNRRNLTSDRSLNSVRFMSDEIDIPKEIYYRYSMNPEFYNELSEYVFKLYHLVRTRSISISYLKEYVYEETRLPESLKKRVIERFMESYNLSKSENLGLIEFANLIFPEFYSNNRTHISEKYENRLFEEYYYLLRKNINLSNRQYQEISDKLNQILISDANNKGEDSTIENNVKETSDYAQSIVREINHCVKTPLMTVKFAVKNILNSEGVTDLQKEKLETINSNISMIESIINGYRQLVVFSNENIYDNITTHISTVAKAINQQYSKSVKLNIKDFVNPDIAYGNNIITIMLLPLIHNALEASPVDGTITVKCVEKNKFYTINVENYCESPITIDNLNQDGFTTKEKGGEGLRSVRRISAALGFEFSIKSYEDGNKVVAILKIPKKVEDNADDKK